MATFEDSEVRAAALAKVAQLGEAHRGRVPRTALMEGVKLGGLRIPLWNYQKGISSPPHSAPRELR